MLSDELKRQIALQKLDVNNLATPASAEQLADLTANKPEEPKVEGEEQDATQQPQQGEKKRRNKSKKNKQPATPEQASDASETTPPQRAPLNPTAQPFTPGQQKVQPTQQPAKPQAQAQANLIPGLFNSVLAGSSTLPPEAIILKLGMFRLLSLSPPPFRWCACLYPSFIMGANVY